VGLVSVPRAVPCVLCPVPSTVQRSVGDCRVCFVSSIVYRVSIVRCNTKLMVHAVNVKGKAE
jgi:hypothetical protein